MLILLRPDREMDWGTGRREGTGVSRFLAVKLESSERHGISLSSEPCGYRC
jgi:hypothetical protein